MNQAAKKPTPEHDHKKLTEWSREAEDRKVYESEMYLNERVLLGTVLRIAQAAERTAQAVERLVELQGGSAIGTIEVTGGTLEGPPSVPLKRPNRAGPIEHGSLTKKRTRAGNR